MYIPSFQNLELSFFREGFVVIIKDPTMQIIFSTPLDNCNLTLIYHPVRMTTVDSESP